MEHRPSIRHTHAYKRDIIPHAPLRDLQQLPTMSREELDTKLRKGFEMLSKDQISIRDMSRLHELYDDSYPRLIIKTKRPEPTNSSQITEQLPDYSGAMLSFAKSNGELDPKSNPPSKVRIIFNRITLFNK